MLKITHKEIAKILNRSPAYTRVIIHREGLKLTNTNSKDFYDHLSEIVMKYRVKALRFGDGDILWIKSWPLKATAMMLIERDVLGKFKEIIRDRDGNACRKCGSGGDGVELHIHHIDENHFNNDPKNVVTLCKGCHFKLHRLRERYVPKKSTS